jgi:hypothetical protein
MDIGAFCNIVTLVSAILLILFLGALGAPNAIVARYRPGNTLRTTQPASPAISAVYSNVAIIVYFIISVCKGNN